MSKPMLVVISLALWAQAAAAAGTPSVEDVRVALLELLDGPPALRDAVSHGRITVGKCHPAPAGTAGRVSCGVVLVAGVNSFSTAYDFIPVNGAWRLEPLSQDLPD